MIDTAKLWESLVREEGSLFERTSPGPLQDLLREYVEASPLILKDILRHKVDFTTFLRARLLIARWQLESGHGERTARISCEAFDGSEEYEWDADDVVRHFKDSLRDQIAVTERGLAALLAECIDEVNDDEVIFSLTSLHQDFDRLSGEAKLAFDADALTVERLLQLQPIVLLTPDPDDNDDPVIIVTETEEDDEDKPS